MNFNGQAALPSFLFTLAMLCGTAMVGTWIVWRVTRPRTGDDAQRGFPVVGLG